MTPRRCAICPTELTAAQVRRGRRCCSKSCAATARWAVRPRAVAQAWASTMVAQARRAFLARLRVELASCSRLEAARHGWHNGFRSAGKRAKRAGRVRVATNTARAARLEAIAASAPSTAEAFRRAFRLGWDEAWREFQPADQAAAAKARHTAARRGWKAGWNRFRWSIGLRGPVGAGLQRRACQLRDELRAIVASTTTPDEARARAYAAAFAAARREYDGRSVAA